MISCILLAAIPVAAADPAAIAAERLPFRSLHSRDELARDFDRRRIHPFGGRGLYFDVVVPKSWDGRPVAISREQVLEDDRRLVPLARLGPPEREEVFVEISYVRLVGSAPPRRAIEMLAEAGGAEIVAGQSGDFSGRAVDDALLRVGGSGSAARLLRATGSRHGDLVFVVLGSAPEGAYDEFKKTLATAAVGFLPGPGSIPRDFQPGQLEF